MFGTNRITKPWSDSFGALTVNEIFYTLQGEGPDAGRPAIFIRLSKCNLRCFFCDTEFEKGNILSVSDIMARVDTFASTGCRLVVLTGGEPLLQNVIPLIGALNNRQISVSIETAGTICPDGLASLFASKREHSPCGNMIVISPKTPKLNGPVAALCGALKYIVNAPDVSKDDGLPMMSTQVQGKAEQLFRPVSGMMAGVPIYVQAMDVGDDQRNQINLLMAAEICLRHGYRLSVQLHKLAQLP